MPRIGFRERGLTQIKARRKALDGAAHDAFGVAHFHLSFGGYSKVVQRPFSCKGMSDVAERVLLLVEPAVGRKLDSPARDMLAIMIAWREPQHLNHARRGHLITIAGTVGDAEAHEQTTEEGGLTTEDDENGR